MAGARAFALAETGLQRYEAARLTAIAAAAERRFTLATVWLRRALTVVPNDEARAQTLEDAARLRRLNPWATNLSFSVVRSNNVNGGAEENDVDDLGNFSGNLSADALALEGVKATLNFSTSYRFYQTPRERATASLFYQMGRVRLDDETVEDPGTGDPVELDSGDYATDYLQLGLAYDRALTNGTFGLSAHIGAFDYGFEPYYRFERIGLSRAIPLSDSTTFFLSGQREWQDFDDENLGNTVRTTSRLGLAYRFAGGDQLTGTLGRIESGGDVNSQNFEERSFELGYRFAEPIGPVSVGGVIGVKEAYYPIDVLTAEGDRRDEGYFYRLDLGLPSIEYAGFTPLLTINGSDTESNNGRFTRNSFSWAFTINSAF